MSATLAILASGFGLGLLHALDADHVMAVSSLSNRKEQKLTSVLKFCVNWAAGHSGVLLFSGLLLFGVGVFLPENLIYVAEIAAGALLIALGIYCIWLFRTQPLVLSRHQHGDITHTHLHIKGEHESKQSSEKRDHAPVMVGIVHGLAGSAPALALVPAAANSSWIEACGYLLVFSIGVLLSMMLVGVGLSKWQNYLRDNHFRTYAGYRYALASCSMAFGCYWISLAI